LIFLDILIVKGEYVKAIIDITRAEDFSHLR